MTGAAAAAGRRLRPRLPSAMTVLRAAVSLGLLALLAWLVDLESLAGLLLAADPGLVAVAIAVALADRALMIGKWYPLLRAQGLEIPLLRAARVYLAAGFAALVLPASVGGDVLRAVALGRGRGAAMEVGASIAVERLLGLAASGVLTTIALVVALRSDVRLEFLLPWALGATLVSAAAVLLPLAWRPSSCLGRWIEPYRNSPWGRVGLRFAAAYALYRRHTRTLLAVGALTLVEQAVPILVFWILAHALDLRVAPSALLVAVPLTLFVGRLPIAAAGIGVVEGALVYLLGLFGVPAVAALSLALAGRIVELAAILPGAFLWADLVRAPAAPRRP